MTESNESLVRQGYENGFNERKLEIFDEIIAPDFIDHEAPDQTLRGPNQVKEIVRWLAAGFPDFRIQVEDLVADGDQVWVHVTGSGTHEGEFQGLPATGRHFEARSVDMWQVRDGKLAEHRAVRDDLSMMRQLGALGQPGGG